MANDEYKTRLMKRKNGYTIKTEMYGDDLAVILEGFIKKNGLPFIVQCKSKGLLGSLVRIDHTGPRCDFSEWDYTFRKVFLFSRIKWKFLS